MYKFKSPVTLPASYLTKVHYSGLNGRIAHFPSNNKSSNRTFVVVSGHHTSHERMASFAYFLADYGDVYGIDMPGFGGMDSFTKIGKTISYDNFAEYLYTVLKTRKLTNDVTIFSVSIGTQFVTRMLQRYPDSQAWVKQVVSFVGFGGSKDFHLSWRYKAIIYPVVAVGSNRVGVALVNFLFFNRLSLSIMLRIFSQLKAKMKSEDPELRRKSLEMEMCLWSISDHRTQAITAKMMFTTDLRRYTDDLINVPLVNLMTKDDQYVDHKEVNKSFRDLYVNYTPHYLELDVHMPSIVTDKNVVGDMFDQSTIDAIIGTKD